MNSLLYDLNKLKKINKFYILNVNTDEIMKLKHIKEIYKNTINCCFINLISYTT